jgi:hypothetical protein
MLIQLVLASVALHASVVNSHALVNDSYVSVINKADVLEKRRALVRFVWGSAGFPSGRFPASTERNVASPVRKLSNLEQVDALHISMEAGQTGLSHHFIPRKKNNRLVVFHLGHTQNCTFNDGTGGEPDVGNRRTLNRLLAEGFSVLAVYMPQSSPDNCNERHDQMFSLTTTGSPMKFFLEPTIVSLNGILARHPGYRDISMIGLSGGGWAATLCAAIDPRIRLSVHVAGSVPLYLRWGSTIGHREQNLDGFYGIAGYPDLYILGSYGQGRRQIQVLNRNDDCCFGERQHNAAVAGIPFEAAVRAYEHQVQRAVKRLGAGSFKVVIDEAASGHMISKNTLENVIIPVLR